MINKKTNTVNLLKNLYIPSVYGIGYIRQGIFKPSLNCKITKVYSVWADMLAENVYQAIINYKIT